MNFLTRWLTYQKERFPLLQHGLLVAAFSSCAVAYSSVLTGEPARWQSFAVAFITCLLFFLQLRIADEFKDAEEDAKYRPYRAVPRGLVSLRELKWLFALSALIQFILACLFAPVLLLLLGAAWVYLTLMSVEFFARDWLKARPITYLWTHMLIMPIVDFYATACHWIHYDQKPMLGLSFFLAASFSNGLVIELGRKLRQPKDEEHGVQTYSKLWGLQNAAWVWFSCMLITAFFAGLASWQIGFSIPVLTSLTVCLLWAFFKVIQSKQTNGKTFELIAGLWTLVLYTSLGITPLIFS